VAVDLDRLTAEFPRHAIKQRAAVRGGPALDYVEGHTVIHRLIEATGNCWDFEVRDISTRQIGDPDKGMTLVTARVALTIPGLGTREHIGVQSLSERGGEDLVKGAITDALKKAATLFGVGLHLYGPDYEAGEVEAPRNGRQPAAVAGSNAPAATNGHRIPNIASGPVTSWNELWPWAKSLGYGDRAAVERLIGKSTAGMTPAQVRDAINAARGPGAVSAVANGRAAHDPEAITDKQVDFVEKMVRACHLSDDEFNALLRETYRVQHLTGLTRQQATEFIDWLKERRDEILAERKAADEAAPKLASGSRIQWLQTQFRNLGLTEQQIAAWWTAEYGTTELTRDDGDALTKALKDDPEGLVAYASSLLELGAPAGGAR
jgi:hypothetical protein